MFGLFLRAIESYVVITFGAAVWARALMAAGFVNERFESLYSYDLATFRRLTQAICLELSRSADGLLEDVGTFIITGSTFTAPRRLLRFGGATFPDFLLSLEELPDRARLALPDIDLPFLCLTEVGPGLFDLSAETEAPELVHILLGILRAMADDYGALVLLEAGQADGARARLSIRLLEESFAEGNRFELAPAG